MPEEQNIRRGPSPFSAPPYRADVRAAMIRDLATLASGTGPLDPAASAKIARLYQERLEGPMRTHEAGHRVRTGLMVA
ncbi:MAG: hypothetical protein P8J59_07785 [Phycisphaerales bacterium]|nr:hypothetical protein [Phycisphaerales bacterium]